jgi:hypothetical protein
VKVYSVFKGQTFRNEHRYANYQHFRVSIKIGTGTELSGCRQIFVTRNKNLFDAVQQAFRDSSA